MPERDHTSDYLLLRMFMIPHILRLCSSGSTFALFLRRSNPSASMTSNLRLSSCVTSLSLTILYPFPLSAYPYSFNTSVISYAFSIPSSELLSTTFNYKPTDIPPTSGITTQPVHDGC
ncbi:hypothetical protein BDN70DRAFT_415023 [Pholiota conissans]|uniref:Uncharacterized protein n=1 Tax=Pholiota conissans TaxID=109636 RepID=A0A9P5YQ40_9AGAR|nr:hypothetical protein BDN70DRAFT_415023 [Pholiota conissans]